MERTKKTIQIPIDADLLERIDASAAIVAENRATFIRQACQQRLKRLQDKKLDGAYTRGYKKIPENKEWAESSAKLLAIRLAKEKW
jgi:metal-responsive CopG/Arc/MetJ family transcriptional regulator